MREILRAQDLIKEPSSSFAAGFDSFIYGYPEPKYTDGYHDFYKRSQGWLYAKDMAKGKGLAFTNAFRCDCGGYPFLYGGFWVCNKCGNKNVDRDWWNICVEKDGDEYCCHGLDFIDLQESSNYAFGETFNEAIDNYEKLYHK